MDNWYNKQFTRSPDENDKSRNTIVLAVFLLHDAARYWLGHPNLNGVERRVPIVAPMLGNTEGACARILHDLGFASTRPAVRNIRSPLDIICEVSASRPHRRSFCLSKETVSCNTSLLNLLQLTRGLAQHTRPVVPVLCHDNSHYHICEVMDGEKRNESNVRQFLQSLPIFDGSWHAYKFCVAQRFPSFCPIVIVMQRCNGPLFFKADYHGDNHWCTTVVHGD